MSDIRSSDPPRVAWWNDPDKRGYAIQAALLLVLAFLVFEAVANANANMRARGIPTDFSFWNKTAGFDVNLTLIEFSAAGSTYGRAFWVGLLNTLMVASISIVLATIIGFLVGIARLSSNWIVARLATVYVETLRNIPLLLQLLFWYNAVLKPLPNPRDSISIPALGIFLNNRGLVFPEFRYGEAAWVIAAAFVVAVAAAFGYRHWARGLQKRTGEQKPVGWVALGLIVGLPLIAWFATGRPITVIYAELRGFNFVGGSRVLPEFGALMFGLSLYTASFIAEIVRGGVMAVSHGQTEAASALGLRRGQSLKLVIIPQAMRIVIPPLTNQYLNLTKNSSLAVFIGYPDLVQVFAGTVLNQTGAAVQVIAITMAVYLVISLVTAWSMDLFNKRMALVER